MAPRLSPLGVGFTATARGCLGFEVVVGCRVGAVGFKILGFIRFRVGGGFSVQAFRLYGA